MARLRTARSEYLPGPAAGSRAGRPLGGFLGPAQPLDEPARAGRWSRRAARFGTGWDYDVRLGAGLVAAFSGLIAVTALVLNLDPETTRMVILVVAGVAVADIGLLSLPWDKCPRWMLLAFPLLLLVGGVVLALLTNGVAADYSGFITLAFLYIGLTQPRGTGLLFALVAGPSWVIIQQKWQGDVAIKLALAVLIWVLISDVLAIRTARDAVRSQRLVARASTDVLTGLGNHRALSDRITRLAARPVASGWLLLIDLDGFKRIQDAFGHAIGDELRVVAAKQIQATLRDDDLVARLGGAEFAVVLEEGELEQAQQIAARLLLILAEPITLSRSRLSVTASIGIVGIVPGATPDLVLSQADLAMYQAKSAGRNQMATYEDGMHDRMVRRLELETDLRDGMDRDEFEVHYQPIIHMVTGAVVGSEALVRWRHPERGLVAPAEFLGACQELGLMEALGERVLLTACRQAHLWQSVDPAKAFSLAVNMSAEEVFSTDFISRVQRILEVTEMPAGLLVLEITEHIIMADKVLARRRMRELHNLGVRIAIDDFGTGYSSLSYLREFPVDILKIDRSFVTPLGDDDRAAALFGSILAIAEALSLDVIVEGIETASQAELVVELGCHVAQGYYYGRPESAESFGTSPEAWSPILPIAPARAG
jgi:diguanylate cyclase (GGDEF)-like protein